MIENSELTPIEKSDIIIDRFLNSFKPPFSIPETVLNTYWLSFWQEFQDNKIDSDTIKLYVDLMLDEGLICLDKDSTDKYVLTTLGRRIKRRGGWLAHLKQEKEDKKNQRKNIKASIRTNKSVRRTNRFLWFSSALTLLIVWFSAHTDKQALDIAKREHNLNHKQLQYKEQSGKTTSTTLSCCSCCHKANVCRHLRKNTRDTIK